MVKIEAIIRPNRVEAVMEALYDLQYNSVTVIEAKGSGRTRGISHTFRGSQYSLTLTPNVKIEIIVKRENAEEVVQAIMEASQTGEVGDGMIVVVPIEDSIRIRTGERGETSIS